MLVQAAKTTPNVEIINNSTVKEIYGDDRVEGLKIQFPANDEERDLKVEGIFIEIGAAG